jgi:hypothetical protein
MANERRDAKLRRDTGDGVIEGLLGSSAMGGILVVAGI